MEITISRQEAEWLVATFPIDDKRRCFYSSDDRTDLSNGIEPPGRLELPQDIADRETARLARVRGLSETELRRPILMAYAKQARWTYETGGVTVGDMHVATDDRAKTLILLLAQGAGSDFETVWHDMTGKTYRLDLKGIQDLAQGITTHIADAFKRFDMARSGIEAGQIVTEAQIDAIFTS